MNGDSEARENARGCAFAIFILAVILWFALFVRAASHYHEITKFGYPGAWDIWVYAPLGMTIGLLFGAVISIRFLKRVDALIPLSILALVAAFPYLVMTGGGV